MRAYQVEQAGPQGHGDQGVFLAGAGYFTECGVGCRPWNSGCGVGKCRDVVSGLLGGYSLDDGWDGAGAGAEVAGPLRSQG